MSNVLYLELIEKGYRVFPVKRNGKEPLTPNGVNDATNDRRFVEEWARSYPDCNWGVACFNVIVFDLDRKKTVLDADGRPAKDANGNKVYRVLSDEELFEHWNYLREAYGLPEAPEVITGGGGRHYYYKRPYAEIKGRTRITYPRNGETVASNIDIRVGNQYVLAPGSLHESGNRYQTANLWAVDELNELPAEFVEILPQQRQAAPQAVTNQPTEYRRGTDVVERCRRYVEQMEPAVQGQGGHGQLLNAATVIFWEFGLERADGWPIYEEYYSRCLPPYTDAKEIEHKYQDALNVIGPKSGKPRGWRANWKPDNGDSIQQLANVLLNALGRPQSAPGATDGQTAQAEGARVTKPKFIIQPDEDFSDDIFDSFDSDENYIETGFPELDEALDGGLSGLTILGGIPAVGKSSFALQIADYNAAIGKRVLIVSLEMSRKQLVAKTVSKISGGLAYGAEDGGLLDFLTSEQIEKRRNPECLTVRQIMRKKKMIETEKQLELYRQSRDLFQKYVQSYRYILQRGDGDARRVSSLDIIEALEWYEKQTGFKPDLIVTDYLQLFDEMSETGRDLSDKQQVDQAVGNLKLISEKTSVIAVASFNRNAYYKEAGRDAFKESGGIEYTAELMLALQPDIQWGDDVEATKAELNQWKKMNPRPLVLSILKDRYGADGEQFRLGMLPQSGAFFYDGSRPPKNKRNWRKDSPLLADVAAAVADALRKSPGLTMTMSNLYESFGGFAVGGVETDCALYTPQDIRRAINQPKSLLKRYNDSNGVEMVRLVTEQPPQILPAGSPTKAVARELDEQDYFDSID